MIYLSSPPEWGQQLQVYVAPNEPSPVAQLMTVADVTGTYLLWTYPYAATSRTAELVDIAADVIDAYGLQVACPRGLTHHWIALLRFHRSILTDIAHRQSIRRIQPVTPYEYGTPCQWHLKGWCVYTD